MGNKAEVLPPLADVLNEHNGLVRSWGQIKHSLDELNGKMAVVVEDTSLATPIFKPYMDKIDFILSFSSYQKCDGCLLVVEEEDITIDDGECYCSECNSKN